MLRTIIFLAAAGCATKDAEPPPTPTPEPVACNRAMHVDWTLTNGMTGLTAAADLVVRGKVIATYEAPERVYPYDQALGRKLTPAEAGDTYGVIPWTVAVVEIATVIADPTGAITTSGQTIEIAELGGTLPDGCRVEPDSKPVMHVGEDAILFVSRGRVVTTRARTAQTWHVVGGFEGRFGIESERVYPLANSVLPSDPLGSYQGMTVAAFARAIRKEAQP